MAPDAADAALPPAARRALLRWADTHHRNLPWRHTRDPWAVLVSEVMLQQTQVDRVAPRFERFLARFPSPSATAAAGVDAVVDEWSGLGYNRRAVALFEAARACCDRHGGAVPLALDDLLALPGVGPYTARAVLAFAGHVDVGVLDTNTGRVLARMAGRRLTPAVAQRAADASVPAGEGWRWNQAMLDLGAEVCTARVANCVACPLTRWCAWAGGPHDDPARGSAGVTGRQSRFAGSDRQGRGRLVEALRTAGSVAASDLAATAGFGDDHERAARVAATLVADGLAGDDGAGGIRRAGSR